MFFVTYAFLFVLLNTEVRVSSLFYVCICHA